MLSCKLAITSGPWRSRVVVSVCRLLMHLQEFIVCNRLLMISPSSFRKAFGSVGISSIGAFGIPRKAIVAACTVPGVVVTNLAIDVCRLVLYIAVPGDLRFSAGLLLGF